MKYSIVMAALFLAGCGGGADESAERASAEAAAPAEESVFDPLTSALERAEGVQGTVDEHAAEMRKRLEELEQ
jgi:hypothetical protein